MNDREMTFLMNLHESQTEEQAFEAMCERVTMRVLGKRVDPSPGVNWQCLRSWKVNDVRSLVREALAAERDQ